MGNNRVVHFEIPANDPQVLKSFYGQLFGWSFQRSRHMTVEYWSTTTGTEGLGINGGIVKRQNPQHPCMNYVDVESIDGVIKRATQMGGRVALPRTPIPGVGAIACLLDPEGNIFGLMERAEQHRFAEED